MTITMARQIRRQRWAVAAVGLSGLLAVSGAALQGHRLCDRAIPVVLLVLVVVCVAVVLRQAGAAQRVLDQAAEQDHR
jgi:Na+/glutamate symporter